MAAGYLEAEYRTAAEHFALRLCLHIGLTLHFAAENIFKASEKQVKKCVVQVAFVPLPALEKSGVNRNLSDDIKNKNAVFSCVNIYKSVKVIICFYFCRHYFCEKYLYALQ